MATKKPKVDGAKKGPGPKARSLARAYDGFKFPPKLYVSSSPSNSASPDDAVDSVDTFDWRALVTVRRSGDQGKCNACSSFAIASAIEIYWSKSHQNESINVAPGFIHTCLGHGESSDPTVVCTFGVDLYAALRLVRTKGYLTGPGASYPFPPNACPTTGASGVISDFAEVSTPQGAKSALANVGPIVADMYIWQDFFEYSSSSGQAYVPDLARKGPYPHSVCVIGFDAQGWIVKNSYGAQWGDGSGCGTIAYGSCALLGATPPSGQVQRQAFTLSL